MIPINKILNLDAKVGLKLRATESVNCCVTSPPYYGQRDYQIAGQSGLEETPELYVQNLVEVFSEVKRVLKKDGTLWLNLGDSYWGGKGKSGTQSPEKAAERNHFGKAITKKYQQLGGPGEIRVTDKKHKIIKPKDLIGIPWMVAFALRESGWYLRQDIIWEKLNPMPESVTDRCTKSHEYIFLLSKSKKYHYDQKAIMKPVALSVLNDKRLKNDNYETGRPERGYPGSASGDGGLLKRKSGNKERKDGSQRGCPEGTGSNVAGSVPWEAEMANKKSVWSVSTKPFLEAHFAVFPEDLIVDCIKAGCPEGGVVLDCFMGAGTTAVVSKKLERNYIGIELNPEYIKIAEKRLYNNLGMFNEVTHQ